MQADIAQVNVILNQIWFLCFLWFLFCEWRKKLVTSSQHREIVKRWFIMSRHNSNMFSLSFAIFIRNHFVSQDEILLVLYLHHQIKRSSIHSNFIVFFLCHRKIHKVFRYLFIVILLDTTHKNKINPKYVLSHMSWFCSFFPLLLFMKFTKSGRILRQKCTLILMGWEWMNACFIKSTAWRVL